MKVSRLQVLVVCSALLLPGCSSMTVRDVGIGMQLGSLGGHGGILDPIIWGTGVVLEQIGDAAGRRGYTSIDEDGPEIAVLEPTPVGQHVD
jgi:hypothetical protein